MTVCTQHKTFFFKDKKKMRNSIRCLPFFQMNFNIVVSLKKMNYLAAATEQLNREGLWKQHIKSTILIKSMLVFVEKCKWKFLNYLFWVRGKNRLKQSRVTDCIKWTDGRINLCNMLLQEEGNCRTFLCPLYAKQSQFCS